VVLSLAIPADFDSAQIEAFYRGFQSLARQTGVALVGGDTNAATALIVSVCVIGHAPYPPVRRSGARAGHDLYVSGTLGDAALGLKLLQDGRPPKNRSAAELITRHHRPEARIALGLLLAKNRLATAMIDVSDGLLQDLGHVCKASGIGAVIAEERLPLSSAYRAVAEKGETGTALNGGEDYELLFCGRPRDRTDIEKLSQHAGVAITRIGTCVQAKGIVVVGKAGRPVRVRVLGHDHFRKPKAVQG
jgi:thiamine-monophosphate kinase